MSDAPIAENISIESLAAQLADEYQERLQRGERPSIDDYVHRYPQHAEVVRNLLTSLELLDISSAEADSQPLSADPLAGTLGDFRILRELGRGGMGIVYEAEQLSLSRKVALKVLPFAATMDPRQLQRFKNEALAAASLDHPNIVAVHGVGCERGVHYYAMRLIEGQTLAQMITQLQASGGRQPAGESKNQQSASGGSQPAGENEAAFAPTIAHDTQAPADVLGTQYSVLTPPVAAGSTIRSNTTPEFFRTIATLGIQAAEALEHAHSQGIIHRDIKPSNMMIDSSSFAPHPSPLAPRLWITDFGLAHMESGSASLTLTGDLVGTVRYMSPEQALAKRVILDHRTDIYSLGATLYELLTLQPAFAGRDRHELLRQIAFEEPKPPRRINKSIPAELETIVLKAMEKNPADRYGAAQEMADDLRRYLHDEPIRARRPSALHKLKKWARRHKPAVTTAAAVGLFFLILLGGLAGWFLNDRSTRHRLLSAEVEFILKDVDAAQKAVHWPEARDMLLRAQSLLATGPGDEEQRERVARRLRELKALTRIEETRIKIGNQSHNEGADEGYGKAFDECGIPVLTLSVAEASTRIRQSSIAAELTAALDEWAYCMHRVHQPHLFAIAREADSESDPWRRRLREALESGNGKDLRNLATEANEKPLGPGTAVVFGKVLIDYHTMVKKQSVDPSDAKVALSLLQKAQRENPEHFWVNHDLALLLHHMQPPDLDRAISFYRAALALRNKSAPVNLNLGKALHDKGDLPEAITYYEKAVGLDPSLSEAHSNLGAALADNGDIPAAIEAYQKAIELDPNLCHAHNNLGNALLNKGDIPAAIVAYQKAIQLKPNYAEAHNSLGMALRNKGDIPAAIVACQKAIQLKSNYAEAHNNLGTALIDKGEIEGAIAAYQKAIELKPNLVDAHNNLGIALAENGDLDAAISAYQKAIELKPKSAAAHNNIGNALRKKRDLAGAIAALQKAIQLKPNYPEAHMNLGAAFIDNRDLAGAIASCTKAIELKPNYAEAHTSLGNALHGKGDFAGAIAAHRKAIGLKHDLAGAYFNLGNTLEDAGDLKGAIEAQRNAIQIQPHFAGAHSNLGIALAKTGQLSEAIVSFRKAIELDPKDAKYHHNFGRALIDKGDLPGAIAAFQRAIQLEPSYPDALNNLGTALLANGDTGNAIKAFGKAIELDPKNAKPHYHLGNALRDNGDAPGAIAGYRKAVELNPDYPEPHCNLGHILKGQGLFREGLTALRKGHELGSKQPGWSYPSAQWVLECERLIELDKQLPAILESKVLPASAMEGTEFAMLCLLKGLQLRALRLYEDAFAGQPELANKLDAHRYNAACAAALAGCGQGEDAAKLDEAERGRLRGKALAWLNDELAQWAQQLEKAPASAPKVRKVLQHWQRDRDFAGIRDDSALAKLPPAERAQWQRLWNKVAKMLEGIRKEK